MCDVSVDGSDVRIVLLNRIFLMIRLAKRLEITVRDFDWEAGTVIYVILYLTIKVSLIMTLLLTINKTAFGIKALRI